MLDTVQIVRPAPLGPVGDDPGAIIGLAGGQRFEEQDRFGDHFLARGPAGLLVVLPEVVQLAAGGRVVFDRLDQRPGMGAVGARQRHQHPAGTPARQVSGAYGLDRRRRQLLDECQTACHPARMPAHLRGNPVLAQPVGDLEFTQKGGLLEDVELTGTVGGQQPAQRFARASRPYLGLQGIQAGPAGGGDPLVAVDEHKTGRRGAHHHNGQKLAAAQQRVGQGDDLPRPPDAGMGVSQIQMGDFNAAYGDRGAHKPELTDFSAKVPRVVSLQDGPLAKNSP